MKNEVMAARAFLMQQQLMSENEWDAIEKEIEVPNTDSVNLDGLLTLIKKLQAIADSHDYLNHKEINRPLVLLTTIPPIYQIIHRLTNLAVSIYLPEERRAAFRNEVVAGGPIKAALEKWLSYEHYGHLEKIDYPAHRHTVDRLAIDQMLCHTFFGCDTFAMQIAKHATRDISQPGFIDADTDQSIFYNHATKLAYRLRVPDSYNPKDKKPWVATQIDIYGKEDYPVRLSATRITKCHIVLMTDRKNKYWMTHVSPASVFGLSTNPLFFSPTRPAYKEWSHPYEDPAANFDGGLVDVVVIDNVGNFDEKQFRKNLPSTITLNSLKVIDPSRDKKYGYVVVYTPAENQLAVQSLDGKYQPSFYQNLFSFPSPENVKSEQARAKP